MGVAFLSRPWEHSGKGQGRTRAPTPPPPSTACGTADAASSHLALDPVQLGFVVSFNKTGGNATMMFKMLAFAVVAIPIFLFVRSMLLRRPTRINEGYKEFKKQSDLAVSIFMFLIGCVVIFAVGKLVWAWL
jgi:hypothetical protein